jgi:tetratricopeptide (TPR) repeat protein
MAYATMNRTAALLDLGRYAEAGGLLTESEGYFQVLEERDSQALLKIYAGQREMGLGHWPRAKKIWEEGLAELERFGSPTDLARALSEIGRFYLANGEGEPGARHLAAAQALATKLGNTTLLDEIQAATNGPAATARSS